MAFYWRIFAGGAIIFTLFLFFSHSVSAQTPVLEWELQLQSATPSASFGFEMVYDGARQEGVLFGGIDISSQFLNETWIWDGNWHQRFSAQNPSPRLRHAMAYDSARNEVVLFGGLKGDFFNATADNETWVWNGVDWTQKFPAHSPPARYGHVMAYDSARNEVVLFGGKFDIGEQCGFGFWPPCTLSDTWVWDGTDWTQKFPVHSPPVINFSGELAMAYDAMHQYAVLFNGFTLSGPQTWIWDGADWTHIITTNTPISRFDHKLAYDPSLGGVILFCGGNTIVPLNDVWRWNGSDWEEVIPFINTNIPGNTLQNQVEAPSLGMIYDAVNQNLVIYGQIHYWDNNGNPILHPQSTWIFTQPTLPPSQKRPVIIIPGILGSELYNAGELIWADLDRIFIINDDLFLTQNLGLDSGGDSILNIDVGDIKKEFSLSFLPSVFKVDVFETLLNELEVDGYASSSTYFVFPYDWRLDLELTKDLLKQKIDEVKNQTGFSKVDIVAHSMGGLLTKSFIDAYGKNDINKLIFVGTPHLGAPKAAKVLLEGDRFGIPLLEEDRMKELAENSISAYELLPTQKYFDVFIGYIKKFNFFGSSQPLNYSETKNFLLSEGLNINVFDKAETFFFKDLHDLDLNGIDVYNFVGCRRATQAGYQISAFGTIGIVKTTSGDETVPLVSGDYINISSQNKFYIKDGVHSELPSAQGVRETIIEILSSNIITNKSNISNSSSFCNFKGKDMVWKSPVEIHIYDSHGNHTGPVVNNSIEYGIPGVQYDVIDDHKFIFLPTDTGETYDVVANGLEQGTFDLLISENDNGNILSTKVFNDIAITTLSVINLNISEQSQDNIIKLDFDNSGDFVDVSVSAILNSEQSEDLALPKTQVNIFGERGSNGWHKSDVVIALEAIDDNSGILETKYSLDGGITFDIYSAPIILNLEGISSVQYYSVDRAGNNELVQTVEIKIDKLAPEFSLHFDLQSQDFRFISFDNVNSVPVLSCTNTQCVSEDEAGNKSVLAFEKSVQNVNKILELKTISYNSNLISFIKNRFAVQAREVGNSSLFNQLFVLNGEEIARVQYDSRLSQSVIFKKSELGSIRKVIDGIQFLQINSDFGNIEIGILN